MRIIEESFQGTTVLHLLGDFTYNSRRELTATIERTTKAGCLHLMLNLEHVPFIDSAALGLLALLSHTFAIEHRHLSLLRPHTQVREILALANIPMIIPVYEKEDEALSATVTVRTKR